MNVHKNFSILVAEDNVDVQDIITLVMEDLARDIQISTDFVFNGLEAFKKLKTKKYDLIITDLNMPKIDGEALIEIIKCEGHPSSGTKVLVLAGDPSSVQHLFSDNLFTLSKPFDAERLRKLTKVILASSANGQ